MAGKVTKVVTFGAFVEILDGVEGLVHISELAPHHVENPREVVAPGHEIRVKILEIDSERRRLSLSVKRVEDQVLPATGYVPPADGESTDVVDEGEDPGPPTAPDDDAAADDDADADAAPPASEAGDLDDVPSLELSEDVFADNERS